MSMLYSILGSAIGGMFLYFSYYQGFAFLSFICFVPYFFSVYKKSVIVLLVSSFIFLITWLILHCSFLYDFYLPIVQKVSIILVILVVVSKILPFVFLCIKSRSKFLLFIISWLIIEYLWLNWEFKCPFFSLGVPITGYTTIVQWYSITGVLGGSLWVLIVNILISKILGSVLLKKNQEVCGIGIVLIIVIFLPVTISLVLYFNEIKFKDKRTVRIIAYSLGSKRKEVSIRCLDFIRNDSLLVDYTVLPEMTLNLRNELPQDNNEIVELKKSISKKNNFLLSADLLSWKNKQVVLFMMNKDEKIQLRYKQELVAFGESIPYSFTLNNFVKKYNYRSYLKREDENPLFISNNDTIMAAICYEGFFNIFLSKYLINGAEAILISAREPFSGNKHYQRFSKLLNQATAITFRKYIVRSSWGGNSLIVNSKGVVVQEAYDKDTILSGEIKLNSEVTPFCKIIN